MDAIYRNQRHFYDQTRRYFLLGRDALIRDLAPPPNGSVLEIGCGTARNLIAVARAWPGARCYGLDVSPAMLDTATRAIAREGLGARITLGQGDATRFDAEALFGEVWFDRVFLSFTISMIDDWRGAIAAAARLVAPGGRLEIIDFGQQERLPALFRKGLFAWLAAFEVTPRGDLRDAIADIADREGLLPGFASRLRGYVWRSWLTRPY